MAHSLEDVALRVAVALGPEDCVLIGGLAVGAHGYVRATADVDFVVRDLSAASTRLRQEGLAVERISGSFTCLRGTIGDVRFDVLPQLVPIQWDRAITVSLGKNANIRVVDLESLIRLKLKAGGPKDLMDVAALVLRHPEKEASARELAVAYRVAEKLAIWLADPRLKAELAEATRAEEGRQRRGSPRKPPRLARRIKAKRGPRRD